MLAIRARYSALIYPKAEALMKGAQEVMDVLQRMHDDVDALLVRPKTRDQAARKAERHPIEFFETKEDAELGAPTFADIKRHAENICFRCSVTQDLTWESIRIVYISYNMYVLFSGFRGTHRPHAPPYQDSADNLHLRGLVSSSFYKYTFQF